MYTFSLNSFPSPFERGDSEGNRGRMSSRKEEQPEEFKVVDRRLFTSEGERRTDVPPPEPPKPEPPPPREPARQASSGAPPSSAPLSSPSSVPSGPAAQAAAEEQGPVQFEHLIMSLVTSAMLQLGLAAPPGEPAPRPDLPAAQETIDLLALLQQKTKGNLTREEEEILSGSLSELRLAFVELSRRVSRGI